MGVRKLRVGTRRAKEKTTTLARKSSSCRCELHTRSKVPVAVAENVRMRTTFVPRALKAAHIIYAHHQKFNELYNRIKNMIEMKLETTVVAVFLPVSSVVVTEAAPEVVPSSPSTSAPPLIGLPSHTLGLVLLLYNNRANTEL